MIQLDVNLLYLTQHFNISESRLQKYGNKSIEEIMRLEALAGNAKAAEFDMSVFKDPAELIKIFKLMKPKNRYLILRNMNERDLKYVMEHLEHSDLIMGLNFFTRDKLLTLLEELPKEKLAQVVLTKFPPEKFLKMIPERELDFFFESSKVKQEEVMKYMQTLPPEALQKLMENITGEPADKTDKNTIMQTVGALSPNKFTKAVQTMDKDSKSQIILLMTKDKPELFLEFSKDAFMFPMKTLDKPDIIKCMDVLENDDLLEMLYELPEEIMAVVASQIDPQVFADLLCNEFQDILSQFASV